MSNPILFIIQPISASFTGSTLIDGPVTLTKPLIGTSSMATSSSFATTSSAATSITFVPLTASYAETAGATGGGLTGGGQPNKVAVFSGTNALGTGSITDNGSIVTVSASLNVSGNISLLQFSVTASAFKGDGSQITGVISSSFANTASAATSLTFIPTTSSFATTSSAATSITFVPATSSFAINTVNLNGKASGSFTGSLTGSVLGNASTSTTASAATSITFVPATASYATTSSFAVLAQSVLGSITSASHADTASYVGTLTGLTVSGNINVSGSVYANLSYKIVTGSYTASISDNIIVGNATSGQVAILLPSTSVGNVELGLVRFDSTAANSMSVFPAGTDKLTYAGSSSLLVTRLLPLDILSDQSGTWTSLSSLDTHISSSYAVTSSAATSITFVPVTASFATTASAATSITFIPATSSYANNTSNLNGQGSGSFTGSFTGSLQGNASTSTTSSAATSITFVPATASYSNNSTNLNGTASGSFTGSFTGSLLGNASTATTSSAATSITFIPATASYANNSSLVNGQGSGSFTGSFTGSLLGNASTSTSASYAGTSSLLLGTVVSASYAVTASFAANGGTGGNPNASQVQPGTYPSGTFIYTGSLVVTGNLNVNGQISASSLLGNGSQITGVVSSSYATTSSAATSITFNPVTSSYANNATTLNGTATGSFTGSLTGSLLGNASTATTASAATSITFVPPTSSYAITSSFTLTAATASISSTSTLASNAVFATSASVAATASLLLGSVVSASYANNASNLNGTGTGSFTGSVTGALQGNASTATTASAATSITFIPVTASYANNTSGLNGTGTGSFTGSVTGTLLGNASTATTASAATSITFTPVTASYAINATNFNGTGTGSFTGSHTGSLLGNASTATTASAATSITFVPVTASYANNSTNLNGIATGSFTGSFTGSLLGNASTATTASAATSITFTPITASYAVTASFAANGGTGGPINASQVNPGTYPSGTFIYTGSLQVTGTLHSRTNVKIVTGSYTASIGDQFISVDASGSTASIYLPGAGAIIGAIFTVRKEDNSVNPVVIYPSGTDTIDYNANRVLYSLADGATLVAGPSLWMSDGFNTSSIFPSASYAVTAAFAANGGTGGNPNASQVQPGTYPSGTFIYTGSLQVTGTLHSRSNIKIVTGSYTASIGDQFISVDASGSTASLYLPAVSNILGTIFTVRKEDNSTNPVIIYPAGADTIDYNPNRVLYSQADAATLVAGPSLWMSDGFNTSSIYPSASYAITASAATSITFVPPTSSYALTSSILTERSNIVLSTTSQTAGSTATGSVVLAKTFILYGVSTNGSASRVRLYSSSSFQTADALRNIGSDPSASSGVIADIVTSTSSSNISITPFIIGANVDSPPTGAIYYYIQNRGASTSVIQATFTILPLEA